MVKQFDISFQTIISDKELIYSETLNNEYIGIIYQMSSWQFCNEFYTIYYVNFSICENKLNSHEYAGTVL